MAFKPPPFLSRTFTRVQPYFPAVAFFGGFLWDAFTLGSRVKSTDLFILGLYYLGAASCLVMMGRGVRFRFSENINLVLQFFLGGLFSALVVFYFISSNFFGGYLLVLAMVVLLVANEFLRKRYEKFTLSWMFFCFCGTMLLNFSLPHLFRSVNPAWFYVSSLLALGMVFLVRHLSTRKVGKVWPTIGVTALLFLAHYQNWIPPVPLVKKSMVICREVVKSDLGYFGKIEAPSVFRFWKRSESEVRHRPDEKIYCFTSVFLPSGIQTRIAHQWAQWDAGEKIWKKRDRQQFLIEGGRNKGYRVYSYKRNLAAGEWRVTTETPTGQIVGRIHFNVEPVPANEVIEMKNIVLD